MRRITLYSYYKLRSLNRTREKYISYVTTVINTAIHNKINKLIIEEFD